MSGSMKVILTVTSVKGICVAGHRIVDEFDLSQDFVLGYSGGGKAICLRSILCCVSVLASSSFWRGVAFGRRCGYGSRGLSGSPEPPDNGIETDQRGEPCLCGEIAR